MPNGRWLVAGRTLGWLLGSMAWAVAATAAVAQQPGSGAITYRVPLEPIASALGAPAPPLVLLSPARSHVALLDRRALPGIAELSEPELGLAGLRINPRNNGPSRSAAFSGLTFKNVASGEALKANLPAQARMSSARWSPDGRYLAFLLLKEENVELWTAQVASGKARRVAHDVNAAFPDPFEWLADSSGMLVRLVPEHRKSPPQVPSVPAGPVVREAHRTPTARQTIQNLLSNAHDEALFEYYFTSQLALVPVAGGTPRSVGDPGVIASAQPSPDGRYILLQRTKRPYSYSLPASAFPQETLVIDRTGHVLRKVADRTSPLSNAADVAAGPRSVRWRADAPATLFWAERDDNGSTSDRLFLLAAPFRSTPRLLADVGIRYQDILWGTPSLALVTGVSAEAQAEHRIIVDPSVSSGPRLLQERPFGGGGAGTILEWRENILHLTPEGGSLMVELPDGLGRLDVGTGKLTRIWSERAGEELFALLNREGSQLLVWREADNSPRNLFAVGPDGNPGQRLTNFSDPAPAYAGMQTQTLIYQRDDGRSLSGTLYLPPGYEAARDGALPVVIWAYPSSVHDAARAMAGTETGRRFVRPTGFDDLHLLLTGRGYAVFEADMPIFGSAQSPPNDTHVQQLVANAEAAVAKLVEAGIAEPGRIAIGGHSYGAGMVANLLAHSDLFRTGIAMSGAFNRTLTPFGFQATEDRSLWQASEAYLAMSPFIHADKIDEPLLLVHGAADSNSGTYPMQSERLYAALAGLGGTVRYVLLPFEDHHYRARESLMHVMWEIDRWLGMHLRLPDSVE